MTQRTDKELLELAAKAAGITVLDHEYEDCSGFTYRLSEHQKPIDSFNPLNDDGDALRLAVKLSALVDINNGKTACVLLGPETDSVQHDSDPYAATRRAIVRAAAEIGAKL
jgi:hypothetical protein